MKLISILFSVPMVQAILSGNKSMTRRTKGLDLINEHPADWKLISAEKEPVIFELDSTSEWTFNAPNPYGQIGDVLWVKEEYYQIGHWVKNGKTKTGRQKWSFVGDSDEIRYSDNKPEKFRTSMNSVHPENPQWYKRVGRFMPFKYSRMFLRITNTKVERLQDISREDCKREGITLGIDNGAFSGWHDRFCDLWQSINGADSWNANPWVWAISFARITNANEIAAIRKQWNVKHA